MGETALQAEVVVLAILVALLEGLVVLMEMVGAMLGEVLVAAVGVEQVLLVEILLEHTI